MVVFRALAAVHRAKQHALTEGALSALFHQQFAEELPQEELLLAVFPAIREECRQRLFDEVETALPRPLGAKFGKKLSQLLAIQL